MKNFGLKTDLGRKLFFLCKIALENDLKPCNHDISKQKSVNDDEDNGTFQPDGLYAER